MVISKTRNSLALAILAVFLWTAEGFPAQGQWGGFIYLIPKQGVEISAAQKADLAGKIAKAAGGFENDFDPEKGRTETIQFYKGTNYTLEGKPVTENVPAGLILVESMNRRKLNEFFMAISSALQDFYVLEYRFAVTRQLNYTGAQTLDRLKQNAPKREDGRKQPNAVLFPLSKSPQWWALTQEKRQAYFFRNPELFGANHQGHNEVGFRYIQKIFRKLYHSRFVDPKQDFVTYFEYADEDAAAFHSLLDGLRDKQGNPEWNYVQENPIFRGRRVPSPEEML